MLKPILTYCQLAVDTFTPVLLYQQLTGIAPYSLLFESVEGGRYRGRYSVIACHPDAVWTCENGVAAINDIEEGGAAKESLERFLASSVQAIPAELPPMVAGVFGNLGFEMVRLQEELPPAKDNPLGVPDACLFRPQIVAVMDHLTDTLTLVSTNYEGDAGAADALLETAKQKLASLAPQLPVLPVKVNSSNPLPNVTSNFTKEQFCQVVDRCKDYILAGDAFQIVPSQRFEMPCALDSFSYYRRLRRLNPSPFLFHVAYDGYALVGSSPEILVRLQDDTVTVRPIAGTRPRGKTPAEDDALAADLLADPKECAEHLMLVDLGRNDVSQVAQPGTVKLTEKFTVEQYSHVMHIVSQVEGQVRPDVSALEALLAGFPAGTVSGAPKVRAMEIIHEMEPCSRNFYAGGVGYFSARSGEMDTCIALRTAMLKDGKLYVQAGAGVVADSDPESEYEETRNKAAALLRAALV